MSYGPEGARLLGQIHPISVRMNPTSPRLPCAAPILEAYECANTAREVRPGSPKNQVQRALEQNPYLTCILVPESRTAFSTLFLPAHFCSQRVKLHGGPRPRGTDAEAARQNPHVGAHPSVAPGL